MTSEDGKYEVAFVTDVGQLKDKSFNQGTFDGVKLYAANAGKSYKYYQPAGGDQATDDDRYDAMKAAAEGGAKVIVAAGSCLLLNVVTDPFLGYFRNVYIFGQEYTIAKALTKITGGVTFVNSVASTVCVVLLYLALRPALERANLLPKAQKASEPKADKYPTSIPD